MITFVGEYSCKVDAKGRLLLPSGLLRQMKIGADFRFVVRKNTYETCLDLYPQEEWTNLVTRMKKKMNVFNPKHAKFLRDFLRGTAELLVDSSNRILLSKRLMEIAGLTKEVILIANAIEGKIEVWDKDRYDATRQTDEDFSSLAEEILGADFNLED